MSPLLAAALSATFSLLGYAARSLTGPGAAAAFLVGLPVLAGTGWPGGAALAAFFLSSSAVSRLAEPRLVATLDTKGSRRDPWQVAANGGMAAAGGLVGAVLSPGAGLWMVTAALAAAASDTWATSVGAWSPREPMDLLSRRRVPRGTSGGVSLTGTIGGLAGAAAVSIAPVLQTGSPALFLPAFLLGTAGMVADSLLGATVQGRFRCPACRQASERRRHRCGTATQHTGGWRWIGNDGVNAIATSLAGMAGALWYSLAS